MKKYTSQYTLLFSLTWASMFLIHPSWALPISTTGRGFLFFGLIGYFAALAYIVNQLVKALSVNEPAIVCPPGLLRTIKDNVWLLMICFVAVLLHIIPISSPIYLVGDEALFLQNGLWIYDYFGAFWHKAAKYAFWLLIILTLVIARMKSPGNPDAELLNYKTRRRKTFYLIFPGLFLLVIYFIMIHDLPFQLRMIRYPPLQNFLYLFSYFIVGINYIGPRLIQLGFYILSAVYIYRIMTLFYDKETALLGSSVYLFSPIIFAYAHFAELASGVVFFIIISSFYFLRFIIYKDERGLLLSSYFIGTGFLYKRDVFLMFFICSAYLVFHKLKNRDFQFIMPIKILSLSLFPIIPWMIIGHFFNWRNAAMNLTEFTSLHKVTEWMLMIPESVSWGIFSLVVLSVFFVLIYKRDNITIFFALLFTAFYLFYTAQYLGSWIRMSSSFYPSIAIFLALFLKNASQKMKWKHTFKVIYAVLTVYMIIICAVPSLSAKLITYRDVKAKYFPNEKAVQWIRENVKDGEKLLSFRFKPDMYYRDKYGISKDKIVSFWYGIDDMETKLTAQDIKAYCVENNISYILFPYGQEFQDNPLNAEIRTYVKENKDDYEEVARYNLDNNYIYIYQIRNN